MSEQVVTVKQHKQLILSSERHASILGVIVSCENVQLLCVRNRLLHIHGNDLWWFNSVSSHIGEDVTVNDSESSVLRHSWTKSLKAVSHQSQCIQLECRKRTDVWRTNSGVKFLKIQTWLILKGTAVNLLLSLNTPSVKLFVQSVFQSKESDVVFCCLV